MTNEASYWQAVLTRDRNSDGRFVYAVRSTGIYCRPSCPSRRPKREQVLFFLLPQVAEQAGFRACRRCQPRTVDGYTNEQVELVHQACRAIEAHLDDDLSLASLGAQLHISPHHLQRSFKRIVGITPRQYAETCRLGRFKSRLREGETVTSAMYEAGYSSSSRLYERAPAHLGMTPTAYRKGGLGMNIVYTIVDSPLGRLLVAATERGICGVSLGDSDATLEAALRHEYPAAQIQRDEAGLKEWAPAFLSYLNGRQPDLSLPVDVQATAFQWQVWEALRAIPSGSTRSYSEVAQAIGHPRATRAVARACATNPVALVIPCHRVVRQDGHPGGYRWGIARKQQLLEQEKAAQSAADKEAMQTVGRHG
ncbi:MAG TPA: bifunctional DNA-binding transcriptional regulator/O6-methylguanine-DNA methyltransferase Ada [Ktedonobacterales bacterium]|jgi:AraC family transcriptional regulator of adaptative response/methylated-DNA-[protein]-cysteine methyltransferase